MRATVVIRSKDEAFRLRLTLMALARQTEPCEVVVVNDGSSDTTREVIAAAGAHLNLLSVNHEKPAGRSAAANAGATKAGGDVLIFLDGDTLPSPGLVARHLEAHRAGGDRIVRGETWHLRGVRDFLDPASGSPMPGQEARVARMSATDIERAVITPEMLRDNFAAIERRAQPGIYPGFGPRRLMELEMEALRNNPDCPVLWAAASGNNQSLSREGFLQAGGFHPEITINEHRELALRLCQRGFRMVPSDARTYHQVHRSGWRDPLKETGWEDIFYDAHPLPEVALLPFFWASLADPLPFPREACIQSLPELAEKARRYQGLHGLKSVREAHLVASMPRT